MTGAERVDLPSGGWVALKSPAHVTVRGRRPVLQIVARLASEGETDIGLIDDAAVAAGVALIAQWSWSEPVNADTFQDLLTQQDMDVLQPKLLAAISELQPRWEEPDVNPSSPTDG